MADQESTTSFLAYHYPALQAGPFVIEQEMLLPSGLPGNKVEIPAVRQYFVVSGERFYISPDQVFAVFPPKDSQGAYTGCMPHLELKRSTLPWERNGTKEQSHDPAATRMPWLALLLVSESDIAKKDVVPVSVPVDEYMRISGLPQEPVSIQNMEELHVLKCTKEYLDTFIPAPEDLKLLAHVRKVLKKDGIAMGHIPDERAVVVAGNMPEAGNSYTAHLVSLEGRYEGGTFIHKADAQQMDWLVSLYSWRFTCIDDENYKPDALALSKLKALADAPGRLEKLGLEKNRIDRLQEVLGRNLAQDGSAPLFYSSEHFKAYLKEENIYPEEIDTIISAPVLACFAYEAATLRSLLNNLNAGPLKLELAQATAGSSSVASYLDFGSVPLPHHLRAGGHTVSWYRGPFVAFGATFEDDEGKVLTYQHADELIQFNKDTGLLDMTYAAAWELGRLLFINEPKLVQQLQLWKQEHNFDELLEQQRREYAHLAGFIAQPKHERLPDPIVHFLLQSFRFINFPFNYLVPDKRMLPEESLRFFKVDEVWLRSFLYGVISVGEKISFERTRTIVQHIRAELRQQIEGIIKEKDYYTNGENAIYGVLIRSDAVSGWPALQVEAYHGGKGPGKERKQIALLHKSYLSEDVMLCLFYGKMEQVVLYLPMGAAHFGFDRDAITGSYSKILTDNKTQIEAFASKAIDAAGLAAQMSVHDSGSFAVELLHKQDMVTFEIVHS